MSVEKRLNDEGKPQEPEVVEDDGWIGPMPSEAAAPKTKKRKGFLALPTCFSSVYK